MAARFRENRRTTSPQRVPCLTAAGPPVPYFFSILSGIVLSCPFAGSVIAYPWIENPVEYVHHEIGRHYQSRQQNGQAHDDRIVSVGNSAHVVLAQPRYGEYELNQEAAGDNKAQKRTSLGDNGYQGVAKNMLHHNCSVGKSFGKRRPHIVLLQSLQHASSGEPCEIRGQGGPQRNRGQHPILPPMPRGCGKPTQFHGEDVYQDRADDEVRHRPSQGGIEYRGVVSPRVVLQRRHYTGGHTNNDPQPKSHDPQVQADRERITDDIQHLSLIHISEPTRRTPISYAVFCLKKKKKKNKKIK